jgi:hypothetical protein
VVLDSPRDYQVALRDAKNLGTLRVRGKLGGVAREADALEYRVGTEGKPGEFPDGGGKGFHFSGPGLREHASRWAEKVGPWLGRQAAGKGR